VHLNGWLGRKHNRHTEHHCATGPDSHRGIGTRRSRAVKATPCRMESVPPGALGGCFDGR